MTAPTDFQEPTLNPDYQPTAEQSQKPSKEQTHKTEGLLSALGTTALVSILLSWAVMVAYFSYFPPVPQQQEPQQRVMAVDMMLVGATIAQMTGFNPEKSAPLFEAVEKKLTSLRQQGVVVLDTRVAIVLPPEAVLEPQDLIPNVPEDIVKKTHELLQKSHVSSPYLDLDIQSEVLK